MKVKSVEIFDCEVNRRDPSMAKFNPVMVRVNTDSGLSGIGEVGLAYGAGAKAGVGIVRDLASLIIGKDARNIEAIWESLFRDTFWGQGGGNVHYAGMSAIDIALWDICGKDLGVPIYRLLGGKSNERLRVYASQLQFGWSDRHQVLTTAEEYGDAALAAMADGYTAVKVDPLVFDRSGADCLFGPANHNYYGLLLQDQVRMAEERIAAIRSAVGPDVDIILELHSMVGANAAIQLSRALEKYNIFFMEEPTNPLNASNLAKVADKSSMPVATGERSYTRWGYRELLERQALAVVQPDLCLCGGITEGKKIADYANIYDATVQVHVCGGPVSLAASLHLETAIPNFIIHEHHTWALKECIRELCTNDYQPENGYYVAPELPGLGQELNESIVKEYLVHTVK